MIQIIQQDVVLPRISIDTKEKQSSRRRLGSESDPNFEGPQAEIELTEESNSESKSKVKVINNLLLENYITSILSGYRIPEHTKNNLPSIDNTRSKKVNLDYEILNEFKQKNKYGYQIIDKNAYGHEASILMGVRMPDLVKPGILDGSSQANDANAHCGWDRLMN